MRFELHILGCGSALPAKGRNPSAQLIRTESDTVLMDCGEGTQLRMRQEGLKLQSIDVICISHMHGDHYLGLTGLLSSSNLLGRVKPLTVIGPSGLQEMLEMHARHAQSKFRFPIEYVETQHGRSAVVYRSKGLSVQSVPLRHKIPTTGFVFSEQSRNRKLIPERLKEFDVPVKVRGALARGEDYVTADGTIIPNAELTVDPKAPGTYAYCSDTAYLPELCQELEGVDLLYHEATFMEVDAQRAKQTRHSTAKQAAQVAKDAKVKHLLLGHYSARYRDLDPLLQEARSVFPSTSLSEEGMVMDIHSLKAL